MGDATIDYLDERPEFGPVIATWVWREWGFASVADCIADLRESRRGTVPSRFVAVSHGAPAGILNLIECNLPPRCDLKPWLAGLYVHPGSRRRGIGSALVGFCEIEAQSLGYRSLYLYSGGAEGFYRRLGWVTIESMPWEGELIAVMKRELLPRAEPRTSETPIPSSRGSAGRLAAD